MFQLVVPAGEWRRKLFKGLAQILVQPAGEKGEIIVRGHGAWLKETMIQILVQ